MSGRIALMVRGLPSIGIDEAIERFGKYYPEEQTVTYHRSPSFIGTMSDNHVAFVDAKTKGYNGSGSLTLQKRIDLRKLWSDFNAFAESNPAIYTNTPNTQSKAKLYKRAGFRQSPDSMFQVMDTRRIAENDLPYVRALDASVLSEPMLSALGYSTMPAFLKNEDNVIAASRLDKRTLLSVLRGGSPESLLELSHKRALNARKKQPFDNNIEVGRATGHSIQSSPSQDVTHSEGFLAALERQRRINEEIIAANRAREQQALERQRAINEARYGPAINSVSSSSIIDDYDDSLF